MVEWQPDGNRVMETSEQKYQERLQIMDPIDLLIPCVPDIT